MVYDLADLDRWKTALQDTARQIAKAAEVPEGTIKTRIYHAKQLLKRCLSGRLGEVTI